MSARTPSSASAPSSAPATEVFDPDFLQRLRTLFFKLRRRRILKQRGIQQTTALGFTREFKDYRHYTRSDDFRSIDWRLFARVERLFVKLYEEVQEFHVHILLDRSRSMVEPHPKKRTAALRLAIALAYLALMNQHRVSLSSFARELRQEVPPLKGPGHIHKLLQHVLSIPFADATDLDCLRQFRPGRGRRGIVFILSDLLGREADDASRALQISTSWPAETHVVHILEPEEMRPHIDGEVRLVDVETEEQRQLSLTRKDIERYARAFEAFLAELGQCCLRRGVDYVTWTTDLAFEKLFLELLARGSALAQG